MTDIPKLDKVATLKMTAAQIRRCKAAAKQKGLRFSVWARNLLVSNANAIVGQSGSALLDAPTIPVETQTRSRSR
jgi:hypothetical protein